MRLHETGFAGTTLSFVDYVAEFPYFRDNVLPKLEGCGPALRAVGGQVARPLSGKGADGRQSAIQCLALFILQRGLAQTAHPVGGIGPPGHQRRPRQHLVKF